LERVCGHVQGVLERHSPELDYLVYGGARTTLRLLEKQCPFLRRFDDRRLPSLLDIPQPRRAVLEAAITEVWSSTITEWHDSEIDTPQAEV